MLDSESVWSLVNSLEMMSSCPCMKTVTQPCFDKEAVSWTSCKAVSLRALSSPYLHLYLFMHPPPCAFPPPCHSPYLHSPSYHLCHSNKCTRMRVTYVHTHTTHTRTQDHQIHSPVNTDCTLDVKGRLLDHTVRPSVKETLLQEQ